MPCSDVTEIIKVVIDDDNRIKHYELAKRTCGQAAGHPSLLLGRLAGRPVEEVSAYDAEGFLAEVSPADEIEEFLSLKHLFALQSVLDVFTGHQPGGPKDLCAAANIAYDDGDTTIEARILVDLVTDKIQACGGCRGCGAAKKKAKVVFN